MQICTLMPTMLRKLLKDLSMDSVYDEEVLNVGGEEGQDVPGPAAVQVVALQLAPQQDSYSIRRFVFVNNINPIH